MPEHCFRSVAHGTMVVTVSSHLSCTMPSGHLPAERARFLPCDSCDPDHYPAYLPETLEKCRGRRPSSQAQEPLGVPLAD